jgi:hypothetical protein
VSYNRRVETNKIKDRMSQFNKRWSITDEISLGDEVRKFKTRILNSFKDIDEEVTRQSVHQFCMVLGVEEVWEWPDVMGGLTEQYSTNIKDELYKAQSVNDLCRLLEVISCLQFGNEVKYRKFLLEVIEIVSVSNVNVSVNLDKAGYLFFYPQGETQLDQELIESPLSFLEGSSLEHFIDALKSYQINSDKERISSVKSLRRCLEEFLRTKFDNKAVLKTNSTKLQELLKESKTDPQLKNIILQIPAYLDQYFNENEKHEDGEIDENENEFLIYQVGLILRYVSKI